MRTPPASLYRVAAAFFLLALTATAARPQGAAAPAPANGAAFKSLAEKMVEEINLVRTDPGAYAAHLERLRPHYAGKELREPGKPALLTEEGVAALEEAVRFLRGAAPVAPLSVSKGLSSGALLLVSEQTTSGATGHRGSDGSFIEQRAARFGSWKGPIGENLSYGEDTARDRVIAMLIDDGVANRGHRKRLLDASYTVVGVACSGHTLGGVCAVTLAAGFTEGANATASPRPAGGQAPLPSGGRKF